MPGSGSTTPHESPSGEKVSQDLTLVAGALRDMQDRETEAFSSPGIPPVAFGAGGPM